MQKAGGKTSLCSTGGSRWPVTIQNGDVGPPKLRKSLQCAMIRGQDVVVVVVVVAVSLQSQL